MLVPPRDRVWLTRGCIAAVGLGILLLGLADRRGRWPVPDEYVVAWRGITMLGVAGSALVFGGVFAVIVLALARGLEPGYGRALLAAAVLIAAGVVLGNLFPRAPLLAGNATLGGALVALAWPERRARWVGLAAGALVLLSGAALTLGASAARQALSDAGFLVMSVALAAPLMLAIRPRAGRA